LGNETFQKANDAYNQKKYADAIALYEDLAKQGYKDAIVYYNLGNAYFKCDMLAKAILNYERALRLDPANEDIKHNITFVNQQTIDKIDILPKPFFKLWFHSAIDLFSVKTWSILSILLVVIACICLVLMILPSFPRWRLFLFITACITVVLAVLSIVFGNLQKNNINREDEAIIMNKIVTVKSTPDVSGTNLFTVHEGIKVHITDKAGNWIEVRFTDGNKGWILKDVVEVI
jgi:tetratricopeptide (TPR) repeat protein